MKKLFLLVTDGVGLRNFAFTNFFDKAATNFNIVFWNATSFPLNDKFGYEELKIPFIKNHILTDIIKNAKKKFEIKLFYSKFKDPNYLLYKYQGNATSLKGKIKNWLSNFIYLYAKTLGLKDSELFFKWMKYWEKKTSTYLYAFEILKSQKPDILFVPNQRASKAIPFILAAKELKIPVVSFIFSWDNLPKATLVLDADYFFVWSEYMKEELMTYYPFIHRDRIKITGTPQFEPHYDNRIMLSKDEFYKKFNIDPLKKYITFTGDDITTSPYDQYYLRDLAAAVKDYNQSHSEQFGIIFRRVPVDFSGRYQPVIEQFKDVIVEIPPAWKSYGKNWNEILPEKEDWSLLVNIIHHSSAVFNIGSSIIFDSVIHNKPCFFINYNTMEVNTMLWNISNIYKFIHFRSMPTPKSVLWINDKEDYKKILEVLSQNKEIDLSHTRQWYEKIVVPPAEMSSVRIVNTIKSIIE